MEELGILVFVMLFVGSGCIAYIGIRNKDEQGKINYFRSLDRVDKYLLCVGVSVLAISFIIAIKFF